MATPVSKVTGIATGDVLADGSVPFTGVFNTSVGTMTSSVANSASAKAFSFNTSGAYTSTAKLASFANNSSEKAFIAQDGALTISYLLEMVPGLGAYGIAAGGGGYVDGLRIQYGGSQIVGFHSGKANFASNVVISYSSTTSQTGTPDLGRARNAAGVEEINSGTATASGGSFRDQKLRNGILTGNLALGIVAKTANYTVTANDGVIECDAASGAITLTLPAVSGAQAGTTYTLKKTDVSANAVTFDGNASETIDGATTVSTTTQWASITIIRNAAGTAWITLKD